MTHVSTTGSKVAKATYEAQSTLVAIIDNVPVALTFPASSFLGRKASGDITVLTAAEALAILDTEAKILQHTLTMGIDGGSAVPATGIYAGAAVPVPFDATITEWLMYGTPSGSAVLDILKDTHANFPPTDADRIAGTDKPTLTTAQKASSTALTGWTTSITAGDVLVPEIESITTITSVKVILKLTAV